MSINPVNETCIAATQKVITVNGACVKGWRRRKEAWKEIGLNRSKSSREGGIYYVLLFCASRTISGRHKGGRRDGLNSRIIDQEIKADVLAVDEWRTKFSILIKTCIFYIQLIKTISLARYIGAHIIQIAKNRRDCFLSAKWKSIRYNNYVVYAVKNLIQLKLKFSTHRWQEPRCLSWFSPNVKERLHRWLYEEPQPRRSYPRG